MLRFDWMFSDFTEFQVGRKFDYLKVRWMVISYIYWSSVI